MPAIAALGAVFDVSRVVLGGGTALEAKWHHRASTDLDLFVEWAAEPNGGTDRGR